MALKHSEMAFYCRRIGGEGLLEADEELALAAELHQARESLARLAADLPETLKTALPPAHRHSSKPEWTFDRIRSLRDQLLRLAANAQDESRELVESIVEHSRRFEGVRKKLVLSNLRLVVHVASKYRDQEMATIDLIQEGNLGLMRAIDRFDHTRGNRFSTYAYWWVKQGIERALMEKKRIVRLPANVEEMQRRIKRLFHEQAERLGRDPKPTDIAELAGLSFEKMQNLLRLTQQVKSVDTSTGTAEGVSWLENLADERRPSPYRQVEMQDTAMHVRLMLGRLPRRDQRIVELRFGIDCDRPHSFQEIATILRVSRERVRQIVIRVLAKMKDWATRPSPPFSDNASAS